MWPSWELLTVCLGVCRPHGLGPGHAWPQPAPRGPRATHLPQRLASPSGWLPHPTACSQCRVSITPALQVPPLRPHPARRDTPSKKLTEGQQGAIRAAWGRQGGHICLPGLVSPGSGMMPGSSLCHAGAGTAQRLPGPGVDASLVRPELITQVPACIPETLASPLCPLRQPHSTWNRPSLPELTASQSE